MGFENPIVGGTALRIPAIQSPNFSSNSETGVTGWQINIDGSASFYNISIGSSNYFIDSNGNAVFNSVTANSSITLAGSDLQTLINAKVSQSQLTGPAWVPLTYQNGWADLSSTDPKLQVRFSNDGRMLYICGSMSVGTYTDGTTIAALPNSTYWPANNITFPVWVHYSTVPTGFTANGLPGRFSVASNGNVECWNLAQTGGVPNQVIIDATIPLDAIPGSGSPPPTTHTTTYNCNASDTYQQGGSNRGLTECYQGYYSSNNGNQWSLIGFPTATIQSDLSGATVTKTELFLTNIHWYFSSGGTAIVGYSSQAPQSGSGTYGDVTSDVNSFASWPLGAAQWVTLNNSIGNAFKSGAALSIALGQGPDTTQTYYGYFAGFGDSGAPQLRITYTK